LHLRSSESLRSLQSLVKSSIPPMPRPWPPIPAAS
jgi:hypothetical protein